MNIILSILNIYIPTILKKRKIKELFQITGRAFQSEIPPLKGLDYEELLKEYALFAKDQSEKTALDLKKTQEVKNRLHQYAFEMGDKLRKDLHIKRTKDLMVMSRLFYSFLKIDFSGNETGEITINRCYFSNVFSPEVCKIISSLDEGIAEGLSGGMKLSFCQRITEGENCCKGVLK